MGGVLAATGKTNPPSDTRFASVVHDLKRQANYYGIRIVPPADPHLVLVKRGALKAQRFLTAVRLADASHYSAAEQRLEALTASIWHMLYQRSLDVTADETLIGAALHAGFEREEAELLLKSTSGDAVKAGLRDMTTELSGKGGFGVPTMLVSNPALGLQDELIFGSDRMNQLAEMVGRQAPPAIL